LVYIVQLKRNVREYFFFQKLD